MSPECSFAFEHMNFPLFPHLTRSPMYHQMQLHNCNIGKCYQVTNLTVIAKITFCGKSMFFGGSRVWKCCCKDSISLWQMKRGQFLELVKAIQCNKGLQFLFPKVGNTIKRKCSVKQWQNVHECAFVSHFTIKGSLRPPKWMNFRKISEEGWGGGVSFPI